jgi:hypothetical protein
MEKFGNVCCSLVCSIYETVQSAFAVNDLAVLQDCWADIGRKIDAISESSVEQLLGAMSEIIYIYIRWPRSATPNISETSNSNYKHQIQITNIKFKFVTSNLNNHHIKFKFITSNSNSSHQIQIHHIKFKFITSNSNSSHQMHGQRYFIELLCYFI